VNDFEPSSGISDVTALKAFAHPLRIRLYYALRNAPAVSVSRLAKEVESPVAQVSYHLYQLQQYGFIEPAPECMHDRREKWWRLTNKRLGWDASSVLGKPEVTAAASVVRGSAISQQFQLIEKFYGQEGDWGAEWLDAAFMGDGAMDLTLAELSELHAELMAVIRRFQAISANRGGKGAPAADVERVWYILHGFPLRRTANDP
jgi:hypothetical protein